MESQKARYTTEAWWRRKGTRGEIYLEGQKGEAGELRTRAQGERSVRAVQRGCPARGTSLVQPGSLQSCLPSALQVASRHLPPVVYRRGKRGEAAVEGTAEMQHAISWTALPLQKPGTSQRPLPRGSAAQVNSAEEDNPAITFPA